MGNPYPFNPYTLTRRRPEPLPLPRPSPRSYADAAALPPSVSQPERDIQQQQALDRLRGSEEKRDRQLMLDADDVGANGNTDLTEKELTEKIDKSLRDLTAESLYNIEEVGVLRCDKVTKLPRGGVLILMNSIKSKKFLDQPDIAERFAEKVSTNTNLGDPELPRRIEKDNGLVEGELVGLKWIKNPARRSPDQRHAHIVADTNSCTRPSTTPTASAASNVKDQVTNRLNAHNITKPNPHCVTCNEAGHATWDRDNCPKYFIPNNSRSMHTADDTTNIMLRMSNGPGPRPPTRRNDPPRLAAPHPSPTLFDRMDGKTAGDDLGPLPLPQQAPGRRSIALAAELRDMPNRAHLPI
ncbi:hypothetical protein RHS01_09442 [Rhizoctonia solani]|uniref:Uncharacterized protein n=1 Tax=Rhizoctonia solani TaxID=456999 RepID=A0A8H7I7E3_9AGAM|nr:hypothetical protein RHS01_09442 [Rhizoctonia solani]